MSTWTKWSVLLVALLMMGTYAAAQTETQPAQDTNSPANSTNVPSTQLEAKEAVIYGDVADRSAGDPSILIAQKGVNEVFDGLSHAFANRDLLAFKQLWPSIPEKPYAALDKSLNYFKSASRNFKTEKIDVNGDTAVVTGTYSGVFVNGVTVIPSRGTFHATLQKVGTRWIVLTLDCK